MSKLGISNSVAILTFLFVSLGGSLSSAAVKKGSRSNDGSGTEASAGSCDRMLIISDEASGLDFSIETFKVEELFYPGEQNLAYRYPNITLSAAQVAKRLIDRPYGSFKTPYIEVLEPTYRSKKVRIYGIFSAGAPETGGRMIVDQYEALEEVANFISAKAEGQKIGNVKVLQAGPGTGKTELGYTLDYAAINVGAQDPAYAELSFRWKPEIAEIPYLRRAVSIDKASGQITMINGPIPNDNLLGLFPEKMYRKIVAQAAPRIEAEMGLPPSPVAVMDPRNQQILQAVTEHYMRQNGINNANEITERQYIQMLEKYVEIYRHRPDAVNDSRIIRYAGENPNFGKIFAEEKLLTASIYGSTPLGWDYGQVARANRGVIFWDELYRQSEDFINTGLDIIQNNVVSYGGSPAFTVDAIHLAATNDESVDKIMKNSSTGVGASLDRADTIPMRQPIHPLQAAKTALLMMMGDNKLWIKDISSNSESGSEWRLGHLNDVITLPNERGVISSPDNRLMVRISPGGFDHPRAVTLAPRTLIFMGLIAASTRIETDFKKLKEHTKDSSLASMNQQYFVDPEKRMQIILGLLSVDAPIKAELARLRDILQEGREGITARDTEKWFRSVLDQARRKFPQEPTATPAIVLERLQWGLQKGKLKPKGSQTVSDWWERARLMQHKFLVRFLLEDLRAIETGDPDRVRKLYDDVANDIIRLSTQIRESQREGETAVQVGDVVPIDWSRFDQIRKIYAEQNNGQILEAVGASNEHLKAERRKEVWQPLYQAVEAFIIEKELSTNLSSGIEDYFVGDKEVSPEAMNAGLKAEKIMARFGYNRPALMDLYRVIKDFRRQQAIMQRQQTQR